MVVKAPVRQWFGRGSRAGFRAARVHSLHQKVEARATARPLAGYKSVDDQGFLRQSRSPGIVIVWFLLRVS